MPFKDISGQRFGSVTVSKLVDMVPNKSGSGRKISLWEAVCDCGSVVRLTPTRLNGRLRYCSHACPMRTRIRRELVGKRFGRLVVEALARPGRWICRCDCGGRTSDTLTAALTTGNTKSCGCKVPDAHTSHPLLPIWYGIRNRCANPQSSSYPLYGGRGIRLHPEWNAPFGDRCKAAFFRFVAYIESSIGLRPSSDHQIDRIDTNGDYEPGNLRWATSKEQAANQRPRLYIPAIGGKEATRRTFSTVDEMYTWLAEYVRSTTIEERSL